MKTFEPLRDPASIISVLSKIPIFGGVTEEQQNTVLQKLESATYAAGESVFRAGDEPTHIYLVKSGRIDLQIAGQGMALDKKELGVGECFGHVALISMQRHSLTATATVESEIVVLSRRALIQLRHEDIELFALLMMNIARELARRLKLTDDMLLQSISERKKDGVENESGSQLLGR